MRTCYLKDSLQRDPNIASFAYSYAPPYLHKDWPQVCLTACSQPHHLLFPHACTP